MMDFDFIAEQVNALNKQYQAGYDAAKNDLRLRLSVLVDNPDPIDRVSKIMDVITDFIK